MDRAERLREPVAPSRSAARRAHALLYDNKQLFEKAVYGPGLTVSDFPGIEHYRDTFALVTTLYRTEMPVSAENVWAESGRQIPLDWLKQLENEAVIDERDMQVAARRLIAYSVRSQKLQSAQQLVHQLMDESVDVDEASSQAIRNLSRSRKAEIQDAHIGSIIARQKSVDAVPSFRTMTGIRWLDAQTRGGLRSGRFYVLGGREKGRKTSVMRNIMLNAAREAVYDDPNRPPRFVPKQNVNVVLLPFENDQGITAWDFVAMLAWEHLYFHNRQNEQYNGQPIDAFCNGEDIQTFVEEKQMPNHRALVQAIEYGQEQLTQLPIFIYDSKPENGGLRRYVDLERVINMHHNAVRRPNEHAIYIVDYAQLVYNGGDLFKDTRLFSSFIWTSASTRQEPRKGKERGGAFPEYIPGMRTSTTFSSLAPDFISRRCPFHDVSLNTTQQFPE